VFKKRLLQCFFYFIFNSSHVYYEFMTMQCIWVAVFCLRLFACFSTSTFFCPDEYFQSVEVAHQLVFGQGLLTWEWTVANPVRSVLHMSVFAIPMEVVRRLGLDQFSSIVVAAPLVMQAFAATFGDYALFWTAFAWFGKAAANWSLVMHLSCWTVWYLMARTLSNSFECTLVLVVLYLLSAGRQQSAVTIMTACVFVRPSSAVYWICWAAFQPLGSLLRMVPVAAAVALMIVTLDSWYFGHVVFSPINLVLFNVASSSFYGTHSWHWYFTSGLPTLTLPWAPVLVVGLFCTRKLVWVVISFVAAPAVVLSFLPHKEFRFLFPTLSVMILLSGPACLAIYNKRKSIIVIVIVMNLLLGGYFSMVHQAGPIVATDYLRSRARPHDCICYLTPCHSVPTHARLHIAEIEMRWLECDPPVDGSDKRDDSESDLFFRNTTKEKIEAKLRSWNCDWIVAFEPIANRLRKHTLMLEARHAHWPSDSRQGNSIAVFQRKRDRFI
jgi:phosphatidylinositol glycan class B